MGGEPRGWVVVVGATAAVLLVLDLVWLGVVARGLYRDALGPLMREPVHWPAALAFYAFYVGVIVTVAIAPAASTSEAAWRGAVVGLIAYGTYELTNWAVIAGWPAKLVPIDIVWGIALTSATAAVGRLARGGASA